VSDADFIRPPVADTPSPSPSSALQGERHVSEVAGHGPVISKRAGIGVIACGAAIACGVILLTSQQPRLKPEPSPKLASHPVIRYEAPPPLPTPVVSPVPPLPPPEAPPLPTPAALQGTRPAAAARAPAPPPRLLVYTAGGAPGTAMGRTAGNEPASGAFSVGGSQVGLSGASTGLGGAPENGDGAFQGQGQAGEDLRSRLTPTRLAGVAANVLRNQPYLLTLGTLFPCILQTAMDSSLPGFVTCVVPQDVQGKTGLTLLDRGTRVVGEFRGGVRQGVERFFVVWTRAETPQGVVIQLDSPATDPLGRAGLDGDVDRHFWQRFGGALLVTTVDGLIQAGVASASKEGTTTINTGQPQSVITETLRGTVNIPPTLRKNQGELVSVFVARDLDFSTVYRVQPTMPAAVAGTNAQASP
jgi:type IV secretion system protein VirB10